MILRWAGLIAGALLAWQGGVLAYEELGLVEARHAARDGRPQQLAQSTTKLLEAYDEASYRAWIREDVAGVALDIALELEGREDQAGVPHGGDNLERLGWSARALLRASPMNPNGWCILALATAKSDGVAGRAADQLKACYDFGPREIGVVDGRLAFTLAAWDELPLNLRTAAMIDVAVGLRDAFYSRRTADQLARTIATVAPQRAALADRMLDHYGDQLKTVYAQALERYRRAKKPDRNR